LIHHSLVDKFRQHLVAAGSDLHVKTDIDFYEGSTRSAGGNDPVQMLVMVLVLLLLLELVAAGRDLHVKTDIDFYEGSTRSARGKDPVQILVMVLVLLLLLELVAACSDLHVKTDIDFYEGSTSSARGKDPVQMSAQGIDDALANLVQDSIRFSCILHLAKDSRRGQMHIIITTK